jgi:hypothetical protein
LKLYENYHNSRENLGTNGVLLYLEGKVQLKHFYKNQNLTIILRSQKNGTAFVPVAETGFVKAGKLLPAFLVGLKMAARLDGI